MASGNNAKARSQERERARRYQARLTYQAGLGRRRTRDNLIAGIAGGILILAVVAGQVAYFSVGPGAPAPSASPSPTTEVTPTPETTPDTIPDTGETNTPAE